MMDDKIIFRKAVLEDIPLLARMRIAFLNAEIGPMDKKEEAALLKQLPDYAQAHLGYDFMAYLAFKGEEAVSVVFLCFTEFPASPSLPSGKTGTILNVYTLPQHRRCGYATELLKMAVQDGSEAELSYIELKATEQGFAVYEKLGFETYNSGYTPMHLHFPLN